MFNVFQIWDEMLGIKNENDPEEVDIIYIERGVPLPHKDEFNALVDNWLVSKGFDPEDFDILIECENASRRT